MSDVNYSAQNSSAKPLEGVAQRSGPVAQQPDQAVWAHVQRNPLASMWDLQGVPLKQVARRTWAGIDEDNIFGRASQLAYAFFSAIFPGLIAISSLTGLVARSSHQLYIELLDYIGRLIPPTAFTLIMDTFRQTTSASTTSKATFGILVALFSASFGISALQDTLNTVYRVREERPFWKARLQAIGLTVLVAFMIVGALLIILAGDLGSRHLRTFVGRGQGVPVAFRIIAWTTASLIAAIAFEAMYYFCPDTQRRKWRWFTPGAMIALLGWLAGSVGLRIYLHFFNSYSVTYGSLGAVVILLLWFYITGVMILLGGEVNSEIEHAVAERKLESGESAMPPRSAMDKIAV